MSTHSDESRFTRQVSVLEIIGSSTLGGMENYIRNLIKHLTPDKFRVTCICPWESRFTHDLRQLGVEAVFVTPIADNPEWRSIQMAIEVARLHQVDVFHAHMPKSHVLACLAGSLLHKPVVATLHGMHVTAHELGVALAAKSHLIANCQETYIQALALGIPAERVSLFQNGVDIQTFRPGKSGKKVLDLTNAPEGSTLVGFVGRLEFDKGPDLFLKAAGYVHEILPDVHFAMVGSGSMLKDLMKMRRQLGLEGHLHFVDWLPDPSEVYAAFDILAHTSRNDGTSLVLLEAMACGCPVVGMAVGGVREIIESEHTGMLAEANNWEVLATHIIKLLEQPKILKLMGTAARKRVEENFDVSTNSASVANLLKEVALLSADGQKYKNAKASFSRNGVDS